MDVMVYIKCPKIKSTEFTCICLIYKLLLDIDECQRDTDGCSQICTNTIGSYICSCNSGYRLNTDRHTCNGKFYLIKN